MQKKEVKMLDVHHVSYLFGTHWALKNCTFSLNKGDFLFLCGPSGAGKTTLLRLLYADLLPQQGTISIAGFNLGKMRASQRPYLRREVSVVFQDFKIIPHKTVLENVILPLRIRGVNKDLAVRRVRAAVRTLGIEQYINVPCGNLSGGEKQRVAIARSIVVNPQILIADEPTGNLDPELSTRLMEIFLQFNAHGTTVLLATHNPALLQQHPRAKMMRLEQGSITGANWAGAECVSTVAR